MHPARRRWQKARGVSQQLQAIAERVRGVIRQTRARLFRGVTQFPDKILSLFEPHTEIIRKGKAGKPNEFGKLVQLQEAENQIFTHYAVFGKRPSDQHLLVGAVKAHRQKPSRCPDYWQRMQGFYSREDEQALQQMGVDVSIRNRSTRS